MTFLSSFGPATFYSSLLDIRQYIPEPYQVCDHSRETLVNLDRRKGKGLGLYCPYILSEFDISF